MKPRRILLVLIALAAAAMVIYGPLYSQYRDLSERHTKLARELESVRADIESLKREKFLLENDAHHVEKVLREELGLAKPGEEIYKVSQATSASVAEELPSDPDAL